jgi:hypothetical protein
MKVDVPEKVFEGCLDKIVLKRDNSRTRMEALDR